MYKLVLRIVFLTFVIVFLMMSTIFMFRYAGNMPFAIGYSLLASFTGLGAFSSLFWDDIPDLINEIRYRRKCL